MRPHPISSILGPLLAMLMLASTLVSPMPAHALALTVTSTTDEPDAAPGDGLCVATPSGACTLRAAVMEANALPGADTISVPSGRYELSRVEGPPGQFNKSIDDTGVYGDLDILDSVTITGAGIGSTIITVGGQLRIDRLVDVVAPGVQVTIEGLMVTGGIISSASSERGAGIQNRTANLTLRQVAISGNRSEVYGGGGLANGGTATLTDVNIQGNSATRIGGGGGILNSGTLTGTRVRIIGNSAGSLSRIEGGSTAGGIWNSGHLTLTESIVADNTSNDSGGGIWNSGTVSLDRVTASGNNAIGDQVTGDNRVGGGIWNGPGATLSAVNSTVSGNATDTVGAGLYNAGTATMTNVTVAQNNARDRGRSLAVAAGGTLILRNTIVTHYAGDNCTGPITSQGSNIDNGDTCGFGAPGDRSNVNLHLGTLADNGGFSATHALLAGSAALDMGADAVCPSVDQRGLPRPRDGTGDGDADCDSGAFEAQSPPPGTPPPSPPPAPPGALIVNSAQDQADTNPGDGVCVASGGACTLRAAVMEANARAGADTIVVPAGTFFLFLTGSEDAGRTGDLDVTSEMRIMGGGPNTTFIVSETNEGVFDVRSGGRLTVESIGLRAGAHLPSTALVFNAGHLTLLDVEASGGYTGTGPSGLENTGEASVRRAIFSNSLEGIKNSGSLSLTDVTISNCWFVGLHNQGGSASLTRVSVTGNRDAGIVAEAALTMVDSTVSGNAGTGIYTIAPLTLTNVTVSGNSSKILTQTSYPPGGIYAGWHSGAPIESRLTNVTIADNLAPGLYAGGYRIAVLRNTVLARNRENGTTPRNCGRGDPVTEIRSDGGNLDDADTCGFRAAGDQHDADPRLGPLADNGGPTKTHLLLVGSLAVDAGTGAGCPATDQRGRPRPIDGDGDGTATCDVGAVEVEQSTEPPVCTPRPPVKLSVARAGPGELSVIVEVTSNPSGTTNRLRELRFGAADNALIDIEGQTALTGNVTVAARPGARSISFRVRRGPAGPSATVPFTVVDRCGDWPTLVGGGPDAWGTSPSGPATPAGPAPTTTVTPAPRVAPVVPTPSPAPSPTPSPVACSPRPPLRLEVLKRNGTLVATLSATGSNNGLRAVRFDAFVGAVVDVGDQVNQIAPFAVAIPPGQALPALQFTVRRAAGTPAATVRVVAIDACGEWSTLVGGGVDAW